VCGASEFSKLEYEATMPNLTVAPVPSPVATRAKTRHAIFTKKYLDGLPESAKSGSQWEWYYDIRTSGLAVGVGQTGVKTFYLIRKFEGKAKRYLIGKYPTVDIEVARRRAQDFNGKLAQGIDPTADDKNAMTFAGLFDKFMNEYSYRRNITAQQNVEHYKRYLATDRYGVNLAKKRLKDIKRDDIRKIFNGMSLHAPVHANRILALIRSVFNKAISWDLWIGDNPCRGIERNKEVSRERFLDRFELPYLFQSLEFEDNETLRDFIFVALFTGARRGNVLPMRWEDIDTDAGTWQIAKTKNGTPQTIPLVPALVDMLKVRRENTNSGWVFPANSKTGHYVEPKKGWLTVLERATAFRLIDKLAEKHGWVAKEHQQAIGVAVACPHAAVTMYAKMASEVKIDLKPLDMRDIHVHDLRRTLGSWQANHNVSLAIIGRTLNHKSPQSTKVYARLSLDPVREAMVTATTAMLATR
jgi:integrase